MGFIKRQKTKSYNSGTRMIVPGLGILTANIQSVDKIVIKPNDTIGPNSSPENPTTTP